MHRRQRRPRSGNRIFLNERIERKVFGAHHISGWRQIDDVITLQLFDLQKESIGKKLRLTGSFGIIPELASL